MNDRYQDPNLPPGYREDIIDLTSIGREENIIYELTHKQKKPEEAIIDGDLPPIEQPPIPDWLPPVKEKRSLLSRLNILLV